MITIVFGKPRSGKTTLLTWYAVENEYKKRLCFKFPILKKFVKHYDHVFCTDKSVKFTEYIEYQSIGLSEPPKNSLYLLDEIGIGFNNRNWARFTDYQKHFFAMHGHQCIDIVACSQTVDVDVAIRHRAERLFELHRFGPFSVAYKIKYKIGVNNEKHTLEEVYSSPHGLGKLLAFLLHQIIFIPRWVFYKYFNTLQDDYVYPIHKNDSPQG